MDEQLSRKRLKAPTAAPPAAATITETTTETGVVQSTPKRQRQTKKDEIELPTQLQRLDRVVEALLRVSGFFSLQQLLFTFDRVKKSIEDIIHEPFTVNLLAQACAISPRTIRLDWIEVEQPNNDQTQVKTELQLLIHAGAAHRSNNSAQSNDINERPKKDGALKFLNVDKSLDSMTKRIEKFKRAADKAFCEFHKDLVAWYLNFRNSGKNINEIEVCLEDLVANTLPPKPSSSSSGLGVVYAPLEPFTFDGSVQAMIEHLKQQPFYVDQIVHTHQILGQDAEFDTNLPEWFPFSLKEGLQRAANITHFYSHQLQAIRLIYEEKKHLVISTATASGKSVVFNVPVMMSLLESQGTARALYIFPTKALAQDQCRAFRAITHSSSALDFIRICTFDGDTPQEDRDELRENAHVFLTNPDMLHRTILCRHKQWMKVLQALRYVMMDEVHVYSGVFGSHVALVVRRLRRLCAFYGNHDVQFICCSATIGNPRAHVLALTGVADKDLAMINKDTSPFGKKYFVLWNPPRLLQTKRKSAMSEAVQLAICLIESGMRTIVFCKFRRATEVVTNEIHRYFRTKGVRPESVVRAYRAGYTADVRRSIEADLFAGSLKGVIATNALELGVDIGSLDAVIHLSFPGSVASLWQQAGRAGRRSQESASFFVANEEMIDQHFMNNPTDLFTGVSEDVMIDPTNPNILEQHLRCAAYELAIDLSSDCAYFGSAEQLSEAIESSRHLYNSNGLWQYVATAGGLPPAAGLPIRDIEDDTFTLAEKGTGKVLEEIEISRAILTIYEGAVFHHQGVSYLVDQMLIEDRVAYVVPKEVSYWTKPLNDTAVNPRNCLDSKTLGRVLIHYGNVHVRTLVLGYQKFLPQHQQILETIDLDLPPVEYDTTGVWIDVPLWLVRFCVLKKLNVHEGIHAIGHVISSLTPIFVRCKGSDARTDCRSSMDDRHRIMVFGRQKGGMGICLKLFEIATTLVPKALRIIETCDCKEGCPSCIYSHNCCQQNELLYKQSAILILRGILGQLSADEQAEAEAIGADDAALLASIAARGGDHRREHDEPILNEQPLELQQIVGNADEFGLQF